MASHGDKRTASVSSTEEDYDSDYSIPNKKMKLSNANSNDVMYRLTTTQRPKCFSRNAVMARENRLRKKVYLKNLEVEVSKLKNRNKKLTSLIDNQSFVIAELRKEVKYMKNILANSSDISRLIRNIQGNTGMSVTTSLDKKLTLKNDCISKHEPTWHPWDEKNDIPLTPADSFGSPKSDEDFDILNPLNSMNQFPFNDPIPSISFDEIDLPDFEKKCLENMKSFNLEDHNYIQSVNDSENVGICLHVSKHRVSLEFCSSCNENATEAWKDTD